MADLDGLVFENHANAFNDQEEEALDRDVTEKLQNLRTRDDTNTQQVSSLHKRGWPGQFRTIKKAGGTQLLLVAEYKSALNTVKDIINMTKFMAEQEELDHKGKLAVWIRCNASVLNTNYVPYIA